MLDRALVALSDRQYAAFSKALDETPAANQKLKTLMAAKVPWTNDTNLLDPPSDLYDI